MHIPEACNGNGATLNGDEGLVWISAPLYKNNIYCQWQIRVDVGHVSIAYSFPAISFIKKHVITIVHKTVRQISHIESNKNVACRELYFL